MEATNIGRDDDTGVALVRLRDERSEARAVRAREDDALASGASADDPQVLGDIRRPCAARLAERMCERMPQAPGVAQRQVGVATSLEISWAA